jgi:glycosyltransferase 2 family protein
MSSASLSMSPLLRRVLHWGGSSLALIGVVFVAFRLHSYWLDLDLSRVTSLAWGLIAAFALIYGSANLLLALAWWHLLRYLGASATRLGSIRIYGISQLARYLPGNIFHLAGRQALGMAEGIPAGILAKSAIWELGSIAVAGVLFGWMILPLLSSGFPEEAGVLLLLGSTALIAGLLRGMVGRQPAWSFLWQMLFLLVSGAVFVALLHMVAGGEGLNARHWLTIGGAYIAAWLVGLVTPGAPAGVGVREMILLLLLKGIVAEMDLLLAVLLGRLVTVVGDLLFFVAASLIPAKLCAFEKKHA